MSIESDLRRITGETDRFGPMRTAVEILLEDQVGLFGPDGINWLVVPLPRQPAGFYLLSKDHEGQRRGREVLSAFVGPATAAFEPAELRPQDDDVDRELVDVGLTHVTHLRRNSDSPPNQLLARLEDAIATVKSRDARPRTIKPSAAAILRDFRLALQQRNSGLAEEAFAQLQQTGQLSSENLRFLRIELLGRLGRWRELHELPFLSELLRTRRPRAINELLLEMVWHIELVGGDLTDASASQIFEAVDLGARYGSLTGTADVPETSAGRLVAGIAARALDDSARVTRILEGAADDAERGRLVRLLSGPPATTDTITGTRADALTGLFEQGQFGAVVEEFLRMPTPAYGDRAVQAVLELEDSADAAQVLETVRQFIADGSLSPNRRLTRDLDELALLVDRACSGWLQWCTRVGADESWPEAERTLRTMSMNWAGIDRLSTMDVANAATGLLDAWSGRNRDQILFGLDLLCQTAASAASTPHGRDFTDAVLLILAEQEALSVAVRDAYLALLEKLLDNAPGEDAYADMLSQANGFWRRVAAPATVDWGLSLVEVLVVAPTTLPGLRISATTEIVSQIRDFDARLSERQRGELDVLADELGMPTVKREAPPTAVESHWHRLDGKTVGIYSLLPNARDQLQRRLLKLCKPAAVEGNSDKVATESLRGLASRADQLIVDTWHAAHAATMAIDSVRPRERQILPRGRGITGFVQALEKAIVAGDSSS